MESWWTLPAYGKNSIVELGGSILKSYNIPTKLPALQGIGKSKRTILFLLDCLGQSNWKTHLAKHPLKTKLTRNLKQQVITTTSPSTTNTVLTSLVTGTTPATHNWIGYHCFVKEAGGILNALRLSHVTGSEPVTAIGVDPDNLLDITPWFLSLQEHGIPSFYLHKTDLVETPLSHLLYRGCHGLGYDDTTELMLTTTRLLKGPKKSFVFAYWDLLDTYAHQEGPSSELYHDAFNHFFTAFAEKVLPALKKGDTLIMTGDHGCLDMDEKQFIWLNHHPKLLKNLLLPPWCEPRLASLQPKPGKTKAVKDYITTHLKQLNVYDATPTLCKQLFGGTTERIGELIVTSKNNALKYSYNSSMKALSGMHGGLTKQEMEIPLLIWKK